jgi:endonuclease/exonuclease/phosphatase family metal-dependent hydrolase
MVMNTHFSLTAGQRRKQWGSLVAHLWSHLETPLIACGDFNDWRGSIDRRAHRLGLLRNALWRLPMPQRRTFPAHRPRFCLDRIYLRGFRVRDVRVLQGDPWIRLSDHLPVVAEVERQW